jgi:GAF domain-containing protein
VPSRPRIPWLERESKNRDAVWLGVVFLLLALIVPWALHKFAGLQPRVSLEIVGGLVLLAAGAAIGVARSRGEDPNADRYAEHASDALNTLQQVMRGTIAPVGIRDFVQEGLFEPANAILADKARGEVRFSVLVPNEAGDEFVMRHALGHDVASRRAFHIPIATSFAGAAFSTEEVKYSEDLRQDERFTPHPQARQGREYHSIVAVPLWEGDEVFGVFVAVAQNAKAFSRADRIYLRVLGAIMDVARATRNIR